MYFDELVERARLEEALMLHRFEREWAAVLVLGLFPDCCWRSAPGSFDKSAVCVRHDRARIMHGSIAGWSSLAARRAHNPKVAGSNPAPATKLFADR